MAASLSLIVCVPENTGVRAVAPILHLVVLVLAGDVCFICFHFVFIGPFSVSSLAGERLEYIHPGPMLESWFSSLPAFEPPVLPSHIFPFLPAG